MKNMKTQKGITLIALVITIIVMLILVGVSVTVALNGGLFSTAQKATEETAARRDEELKLSEGKVQINGEWYNSMDEYINGSGEAAGGWTQEGNNVTNGTITLKIGDKVEYDETDGTPLAYETDASKGTGTNYTSGALVAGKYTIAGTGEGETAAGNLEWRVLGVNDAGQLELISTTPTTNKLYLYGKAGYENAETVNGVKGTLDTFCDNIYGKGTGAASARSLTAEDINKLGNFNPETDYSGYNTEYTYKFVTTGGDCCENSVYGIKSENASQDISNWTCTCYISFYTPDWTIDSTNVGPQTLTNTYYYYTVSSKVTMTDPVDMAALITKGEGGSSYVTQWLGSRAVGCFEGNADFRVRCVGGGDVDYCYLYTCGGDEYSDGFAVRPVVSLKSDVSLVDSNNDGIYEI